MLMHHAHLLYADNLSEAAVPSEYKKPSVDVLHVLRDRFSIADARELSLWAQQKPFERDKRVFVVVTDDIAVEAQNALLKLLEEPTATSLFYIVVPNTSVLLPTLRSRLNVPEDSSTKEGDGISFAEFSGASYGERIREIAARTKDKDGRWIEEILRGSEKIASESKSETLLRAVLFIRQYIKKKGASPKMLLEELALQLPLR
jgi:DNA polymerase III delta prime subunit